MTSNLQAGVHFRDPLEHLHLIDMHFVLHKTSKWLHAHNWITSTHFQTSSGQSVPSIVSDGLFSRPIITWSAWSHL